MLIPGIIWQVALLSHPSYLDLGVAIGLTIHPPQNNRYTHPPRHACKACGTDLQTQPCMCFNAQTVTLKQTNRSTKHSHVNIVKQADQHTAMYTDNKTWRQTQAMHSCTDSKTQRHAKPHSDKHSHSYRPKNKTKQKAWRHRPYMYVWTIKHKVNT